MNQTKIQDDNVDKINKIPELSSRNKKDEILSAYQDLLKRFRESAESDKQRRTEVKKKSEDKILEKVSSISPDLIIQETASLEGKINNWLRQLAKALTIESQKFTELQEAHKIEKERLEEIHKIHAEADTFAALVAAHKEKKEELSREHEQLKYELEMSRRREQNEYEEIKAAKEKELHEREMRLMEQQKELQELRKLKELFDEKIQEEVEKAREEAITEIKKEEEYKSKLLAERNAAEKQIALSTIDSLKKQLSTKESDIATLKKELEIANREVKDIAVKVIEGRSSRQHQQVKNNQTLKNEFETSDEAQ